MLAHHGHSPEWQAPNMVKYMLSWRSESDCWKPIRKNSNQISSDISWDWGDWPQVLDHYQSIIITFYDPKSSGIYLACHI